MKNILFLVSSMQGGGAERVAALLCNHWVEQGHSVTLVPTFSGRGACHYPLDDRVRLEYLADRVGTIHKSLFTRVRRLFALRRLVREYNPDTVVSFLPHVNVAALLATRGLGVPVVVSERVFPPAKAIGLIWHRLRRWVYPLAEKVVMQTQAGWEWLARECPRARGVTIANPCIHPLPMDGPGSDPGAWLSPARSALVAAGRLEEQKGFDCLIDAFARLAGCLPDWDLVILGEGSQRMALETRVDEHGLSGRVVMPGRVGNPPDWYQRAELYVMSSRFEGFPNTLLEAMAHGLAVVSFDCDTGPRDIIRPGIDGLLVSPKGGVPALADALDSLMADPERRARMAAAAVNVRERFAMERIAAEWDRVLGGGVVVWHP